MAQEHGLPDIPDEAVDEYSQELMDLLLELPAIQQRAKRTRKNNTRGSSNPNGLSRTSSSIASSTTTNHIGFESVSSNEAAVSIRSYGNNDEEPIPNVNLPVALSSDSDLVPGSNSATNSYISMAAPRRIRKKCHYLYLVYLQLLIVSLF